MKARVLLVAVCALACSKQHPATRLSGNPFLAHVPADTPYVLASLERWPRPWIEHYLAQQRPQITRAIERIKVLSDDGSMPVLKLAVAALEEIAPRFTIEGARELGFDPQARVVIYGLGLLPVIRVELSDGEAFRAFLERILTRSGVAASTTRHEGGRHVYTFVPDAGRAPVVAVVVSAHELAVTIAPRQTIDRHLGRITGDLGAPSLADRPTLQDVAKAGAYLPYFVGYIDTARVLAAVDEDRDALNAFGASIPALPGTCHDELVALAATMPRWTFGLDEVSDTLMRGSLNMELRPELARDLQAVRVAVPGVGAPLGDDVMSLAVAVDLKAGMTALRAEADRVAQAPRKCRELAFVGEAAGELARELGKPLPVPWGSLRGVAATLHDAQMSLGMPQIEAYGLIAAQDPIHLVDLAKQAFPSLSGVTIPQDGTPVPLPAGVIPFVPDPYVAMRGGVLGMSMGAGMQVPLAALMAAAPHPNRALMSIAYDMNRLAQIIKLVGGEAAAAEFEGIGTVAATIETTDRGLLFKGTRRTGPAAPAKAP